MNWLEPSYLELFAWFTYMKDPLHLLIESLLLEMRVVKISDGSGIIAYGDKIWLFDEDTDWTLEQFEDLVRTAKIDLTKMYGNKDGDMEVALEQFQDSASSFIEDLERHDIFIGSMGNGILYQDFRHDMAFDPKSSVLVKKVAAQLGLDMSALQSDMSGNEELVHKSNMKGVPHITTAYHGTTTKYIDSIMKIGLRPRNVTRSKTNYSNIEHVDAIFFTTKIGKAMYHAHTATRHGGLPLIISFSIPDQAKIIPDYDIDINSGGETYAHIQKYLGRASVNKMTGEPVKLSREFGIYGYRGSIPPKFINDEFLIMMGSDDDDELSMESFQSFTKEELLNMMRDEDPDSESYGEIMYDSLAEFLENIKG